VQAGYNPAEAWVDAAQAITAGELKEIIEDCNRIHAITSKKNKKVKAGK
jgi:3-deoxy-D-arabino-heptulosonate 7-phosphate (DAHP) synthase